MGLLAGAAIILQSVILGFVAGVVVGCYQGNYYGRIKTLRAWRRDLEIEREQLCANRER